MTQQTHTHIDDTATWQCIPSSLTTESKPQADSASSSQRLCPV